LLTFQDGKYIQLSAKRAASSKIDKPLSPGIIPKNERVPLPPQFRSPLNRIQATEGPPLDEDEAEALADEAEDELEEPPEIGDVQFEPITTPAPRKSLAEEEDEDIAYFFTPEQIKNIRASQDFGEKLKSGGPNSLEHARVELRSSHKPDSRKVVDPPSPYPFQPVSVENPNQNYTTDQPQNSTAPTNGTETTSTGPSPTPSGVSEETTFRMPVYRSSRMKSKTESLFETNPMKRDGEDLFETELRSRRPLANEIQQESATKVPRRIRRLRKFKRTQAKPRKEKAALYPVGLPYPSEQQLVFPNGTKKLLKFKHLIHSDVTESFPPYYSGVRPPIAHPLQYSVSGQLPYSYGQNPYQSGAYAFNNLFPSQAYNGLSAQAGQYPFQNGQYSYNNGLYAQAGQYPFQNGQYAYNNGLYASQNGQFTNNGVYSQSGYYPYQTGQYAYNNGLVYQGGLGLPQYQQPALTYEHHHHHKEGTHHRALEPHHVFPTHQGAVPQKSLPPHAVIPAYYHPIPVNPVNVEPVKAGSSEGGMHLVQSHHALAATPLIVNLGNRFAHHHHEVLPENPIAAHHYAAESHLAVAAFHHLAEPHQAIAVPVPVPVPAYTHQLPTIYSHGAPTPQTQQAEIPSPQQASSSGDVHALNAPEQPFPLTDMLGMLSSR